MSEKIKNLKKAIKKGNYDWNAAIADAANKIVDYPQSLLWR